MSQNAFSIGGNTICLSVTSSAHSSVQTKGGNDTQPCNYVLTNSSSSIGEVFVAYAAPGNSGTPTITPTIPVEGTSGNGYVIEPGATHTLTGPPNAFWSAICASGKTATLYITPGEGL